MKKLPEITLVFWITKIFATTLGETGGDLLSMTLNIGYGLSSLLFITFFIIYLIAQLVSKKYYPALYWSVILATSTAGTTISDYMDRTLGLGYARGSAILVSMLVLILAAWRLTERSLSVDTISTRRAELFYWATILISNTLGTALGDYLADDTKLGFLGGAALIAALLLIIIALYYSSKISKVILFWSAFVLTRPFGATFGDLLTKPIYKGGLNLGTAGSSLVLFCALVLMVLLEIYYKGSTSDNPLI